MIAGKKSAWIRIVDGHVLVTIGGLAAMHLYARGLAEGGGWAFGAVLIGFMAPILSGKENEVSQLGNHVGRFSRSFGLHSAFDGAALASSQHDHHDHLSFAVILHRIPAGLLVYSSVVALKNRSTAWVFICFLAAMTLAAFLIEKQRSTNCPARA